MRKILLLLPYSLYFQRCFPLVKCFIESIRNVRNQIKDEKLLEDIKAFIAQEAFHSREHKTLNNHLIHSNYPEVVEIEAKTKARLDKLRQLSAVEQVTATVVMEHYTATLARLLLTDSLIKAKPRKRAEICGSGMPSRSLSINRSRLMY